MASTCALSMAMPLTNKTTNPLITPTKVSSKRLVVVKSSMKLEALTAAAVVTAASMVVPEVAQAASGVSPSLNNFLLSIGAGGVVLGGILGAIIGVSNFDPVKRA